MSFDWLESRRKKVEEEHKRKEGAQKSAASSQEAKAHRRLRAKRSLDTLVMHVLESLRKAAYPKSEVKHHDLDLFASRLVGEWSLGSQNKDGVWESQVSVFIVINEDGVPQHFRCFMLDQEQDSITLKEKDLQEALNALHDHFSDTLFQS